MGVNATFYLRNRRANGRRFVTVPIESILRVEGCSAVACYVVTRNAKAEEFIALPDVLRREKSPRPANVAFEEACHLVVGNRSFVITYIKYLARKHGIPVRLNLGI